ncbi:MAG: type 1 glutamine amidotransferase [Breznakibacter sp.]
MHIHILQHVSFEGEGIIADWALQHHAQITHTRFFAGEPLPATVHFDLLVIMGGPMGIYDEVQYPWLADEKKFIRKAIDEGTKVLGICLGAQLLADALGARVTQNRHKEIGWFPIHPTTERLSLFNVFYETLPATIFHWHGDTFDIPQGCKHLFGSEACQNQAFIKDEQVIGLQFHLELKNENLQQLIENGRHELAQLPFVQSEHQLVNGFPQHHATCKELMSGLLEKWLK